MNPKTKTNEKLKNLITISILFILIGATTTVSGADDVNLNISFNVSSINPGDYATLTVEIENEEDDDISVDIEIWAEDYEEDGDDLELEDTSENIPADETKEFNFTLNDLSNDWDPYRCGSHKIRVEVEDEEKTETLTISGDDFTINISPSEPFMDDEITITIKDKEGYEVDGKYIIIRNLDTDNYITEMTDSEGKFKFTPTEESIFNYSPAGKYEIMVDNKANKIDGYCSTKKTFNVKYNCDLNHDGIVTYDHNDLMSAYKCFLGINKDCNNYYQNWNLIKHEYECFTEETAKKGDTVEVYYVGKFENGTVFDQSTPGNPLRFIIGSGQLIEGFDEAVVGMGIGETKIVSIPPEKAFGMPKSAQLIEDITIQDFLGILGEPPALNTEYPVQGLYWPIEVIAIGTATVTIKHKPTPNTVYNSQLKIFEVGETEMAWGHPLSGKTFNFEITLVKIKTWDKPEVNIFVMSYCPYGTQIEKGIIPVQELLGDKADINIKFVDYIMHGQTEADENTRQYCIDKEQKDKFWSYLACFLEEGNSSGCIDQIGVDKNKLESCITSADAEFSISADMASGARYPRYRVHEDLATQYGVGGSPTVVINDKVIQTNRDPESLKNAICLAFNEKPAECNQTLSSVVPSPGFGFSGSGGGGSCG